MGKPKTVDMSVDLEALEEEVKKPEKKAKKVREQVDIQAKIEDKKADNIKAAAKKASRSRSKVYISARRHVDRTKQYPLKKAVELLKKTSYSKFAGTVSVDAVIKDAKLSLELSFPHSTGKTTKVAIATDALLAKIEKGELNFDILLATPDMMPKIAKHARVLGPKGLMPNPKNKTVTTKPQERKKELEAGKTSIKTEKKAPLLHIVIGKTDQPDKELIDNVEHLITRIGAKKLNKLVLSATMSPGIKVDLSSYQSAA